MMVIRIVFQAFQPKFGKVKVESMVGNWGLKFLNTATLKRATMSNRSLRTV
jgi:hypothetical protein